MDKWCVYISFEKSYSFKNTVFSLILLLIWEIQPLMAKEVKKYWLLPIPLRCLGEILAAVEIDSLFGGTGYP